VNATMERYEAKSFAETIEQGKRFGASLQKNSVICLFGDLGAGKTTFIKGIASALGIHPREVTSPTFQYLNIYTGSLTLYHFDLYRLHNEDDFLASGFEEMLYAGGICCVEWSERISSLIPQDAIYVTIQHQENNARQIEICHKREKI
jgi:tRNA threonylcarbamoyladenosine biosynthesis protein TsaE